MEVVETRTCPVCGDCREWKWGVIRHLWDGLNIVHLRLVNDGRQMASILVNGKAKLS